jgi:uncharacterized membrane protein YqjE
MITTYSDSAFATNSLDLNELKSTSLEFALMAGAGLFWIAALPFVALSLMAVKIWDTLKALMSGAPLRPNPLILRRGLIRSGLTVRSRRTARI